MVPIDDKKKKFSRGNVRDKPIVILKEGTITHSLSHLAGRKGGDNFLELVL